jgi:hypothetical protein
MDPDRPHGTIADRVGAFLGMRIVATPLLLDTYFAIRYLLSFMGDAVAANLRVFG